MSRMNLQTTHPLIPNSQEYMYEQQYVSIHSEDRNVLKYPRASDFEIELPQDYLNVQGFRLVSGFFPAKVNTFSSQNKNVTMTFKLIDVYNPNDHGVIDPLELAIYDTLFTYVDNYAFVISDGNYTSEQMSNEVENRMNQAVTDVLCGATSTLTPTQKTALKAALGYREFVVNVNEVTGKLWIGNRSSSFELTNSYVARYEEQTNICYCDNNNDVVDDFGNWGLPKYLGFTRCDVSSSEVSDYSDIEFTYMPSGTGIWLTPNPLLTGSIAHYIQSPLQMNMKPQHYMYMEIKLLNSMDETSPYNYSKFTQETNQTNGIVKAAFAKIPLNDDSLGDYYEQYTLANYFKIYNPPIERIRKLSIRFRYHNGMLVDFNNQNYSFSLELNMLRPQNNRAYNVHVPVSIGNNV